MDKLAYNLGVSAFTKQAGGPPVNLSPKPPVILPVSRPLADARTISTGAPEPPPTSGLPGWGWGVKPVLQGANSYMRAVPPFKMPATVPEAQVHRVPVSLHPYDQIPYTSAANPAAASRGYLNTLHAMLGQIYNNPASSARSSVSTQMVSRGLEPVPPTQRDLVGEELFREALRDRPIPDGSIRAAMNSDYPASYDPVIASHTASSRAQMSLGLAAPDTGELIQQMSTVIPPDQRPAANRVLNYLRMANPNLVGIHELEHMHQADSFTNFGKQWGDKRPGFYIGHMLSGEIPATLSELAYDGEYYRRRMGQLPTDIQVPLTPPGPMQYAPNLEWIRRQAHEHGHLGGPKTMTGLLETPAGQSFMRMLLQRTAMSQQPQGVQ